MFEVTLLHSLEIHRAEQPHRMDERTQVQLSKPSRPLDQGPRELEN